MIIQHKFSPRILGNPVMLRSCL